MAKQAIDRDKFRAELRNLRPVDLFEMLDVAIGLLPEAGLRAIAKGQVPLARILDDGQPKPSLLEVIRAFEKRSLDGEYFEYFEVNWRNCSEVSQGTQAWMAEYRHLLDRCVSEERQTDPGELREAFEILAGLVARIDDGEEILFFADDGGSWQFGGDWEKILPVWLRATAAAASTEAFAERVRSIIKARGEHRGAKVLAMARKVANPDQRRALDALAGREKRERPARR
jgi:hypothetical protein